MHATSRQLIDYLLDGAPTGTNGLESHLRSCPGCGDRMRQYELLVETMRTDREPEPPAEWVERAIRIHRAASPTLEGVRKWCRGLREAPARIVFDSAAGTDLAVAGTRHVDVGRRLRFESAGIELDLQIEPQGSGGTVTGQFVRLGLPLEPLRGAEFLITAGDSEFITGETDELGEFTVDLNRTEHVCVRLGVGDELATFSVPEATGS